MVFTWSAIGRNFFSLVLSFDKVPEVSRSEYLDKRVCSSSSDHFFLFMFFGGFFSCLCSKVSVLVEIKVEGCLKSNAAEAFV